MLTFALFKSSVFPDTVYIHLFIYFGLTLNPFLRAVTTGIRTTAGQEQANSRPIAGQEQAKNRPGAGQQQNPEMAQILWKSLCLLGIIVATIWLSEGK